MNMNEAFRRVARLCNGAALAIVCLGVGAAAAAEATVTQSPDDGAVKWFECGGAWPQKGCEASLVWGDWEHGTSGWWVRAPKGYMFARHSHSTPERILLVRGVMVGSVDGGQEVTVRPGMYWDFGANIIHWARCVDNCLMYITYDSPFDLRFP